MVGLSLIACTRAPVATGYSGCVGGVAAPFAMAAIQPEVWVPGLVGSLALAFGIAAMPRDARPPQHGHDPDSDPRTALGRGRSEDRAACDAVGHALRERVLRMARRAAPCPTGVCGLRLLPRTSMRHLGLLLAFGAAACGGKVGTVSQTGALRRGPRRGRDLPAQLPRRVLLRRGGARRQLAAPGLLGFERRPVNHGLPFVRRPERDRVHRKQHLRPHPRDAAVRGGDRRPGLRRLHGDRHGAFERKSAVWGRSPERPARRGGSGSDEAQPATSTRRTSISSVPPRISA